MELPEPLTVAVDDDDDDAVEGGAGALFLAAAYGCAARESSSM